MSQFRMTIQEFVEHQKKVKGIPAHEPLERVKLGQAATYNRKPDYARELAIQIRDAGLRFQPILEYAFDKQLSGGGRGWQLDLAWPWLRPLLAVEVDGAAHRIMKRHKGDIAKHQALFAQGWKLLRVSPAQVRDGAALELVKAALLESVLSVSVSELEKESA